MTAASTILGAILFLRFGFAVGETGFIGALAIIVLGHLITIPTALAIAEIATNKKVEGGGSYYIISRSFGLNIGGTIGLALYLSHSISVAFYVIALSEASRPLCDYLVQNEIISNISSEDLKYYFGIFSMLMFSLLMITKGAKVGVKTINYVVVILVFTLILFFLGEPIKEKGNWDIDYSFQNINSLEFFAVFAIIFPAFTGITAGLGLSGDLKNPRKSIPRGTILASLTGIIIYILVSLKLVHSAPLSELKNQATTNPMIMNDISLFGDLLPIVPIGLACATISSALGAIMVAPRVLQAIGNDNIFPSEKINRWLSKGNVKTNEPFNASIITCIIGMTFVAIGDINQVATIITMFFMITYGTICLISLLEHFSADPYYRPTFKSRWYISLIGAFLSFWLMFKINFIFSIIAILTMGIFYLIISKNQQKNSGIERLFKGVIFQINQKIQLFLQRQDDDIKEKQWRPFTICISDNSFSKNDAFDFMSWISLKYGFGTYIHFIKGKLTKQTYKQSKKDVKKLIKLGKGSSKNLYIDTIVSPSYTSALAQTIQLPSTSGKGHNLILFEYKRENLLELQKIINNYDLLKEIEVDILTLSTCERGFGKKKEIHIWISAQDYKNSNLMILISYIMLGHPDWNDGLIKIFNLYTEGELKIEQSKFLKLITEGRLPISERNIQFISKGRKNKVKDIINEKSQKADLTIIGMNKLTKKNKSNIFGGFEKMGNMLFVNSMNEKDLE